MADKKCQVFISSTFTDLQEERKGILDTLLKADCIPAGMEAFVAADTEQFEVIKRVIELCDYYILIIGKRYGSINKVTGISYTEMEYDYAKKLGIPVLVFALDKSVDVDDSKKDTDPKNVELLESFRQKALDNRLASIWKTRDELTVAVAISIMQAKSEIHRPGWQRAVDYDEASLRREIMELQKENVLLRDTLKDTQEDLNTLTTPTNIAYEDYEIEIKYNERIGREFFCDSIHKKLPDLFAIISTEMLDVAVSEETLEAVLEQQLFAECTGICHFSNIQFTKTLLNQFKALGFITPSWDKEEKYIYWKLTPKGEVERNKRILLYNSESTTPFVSTDSED